jgi:hypothetical protein
LFDLDEEDAPTLGRLGQHAAPGLLGLLDHQASALACSIEQRVPIGAGPVEDRRHVRLRSLLDGARSQLGMGDALGRRRLGADLDVGGLLLRVPDDRTRGLLGRVDEPGRLVMRVAQELGALLAERSRQLVVADLRVGRALLGRRQLFEQRLLTRLPSRELGCEFLEIGRHLGGVEAAPVPRERPTRHLV